MKKVLLIVLISMVCGMACYAQTRLGAVLGYGSKFRQPAIGANVEFFIDDKISLVPGLLFYFPDNRSYESTRYFEMNFDGHYYIYSIDVLEFFGLGGFNYTHTRYKDKIINDNSYSDGDVNINVGGGVNFKVGADILPFSEVRYVIGGTNQAVVVVGIRFNVGR